MRVICRRSGKISIDLTFQSPRRWMLLIWISLMETAIQSREILFFPISGCTIRSNFSKLSCYHAALIALMKHSAITIIIFTAVIVLDCYPNTARIKRNSRWKGTGRVWVEIEDKNNKIIVTNNFILTIQQPKWIYLKFLLDQGSSHNQGSHSYHKATTRVWWNGKDDKWIRLSTETQQADQMYKACNYGWKVCSPMCIWNLINHLKKCSTTLSWFTLRAWRSS